MELPVIPVVVEQLVTSCIDALVGVLSHHIAFGPPQKFSKKKKSSKMAKFAGSLLADKATYYY